MIELIKNPSEDIFFRLLDNCRSNIILCAPFIKSNIIKKILDKKMEESNLSVITTSNLANYVSNATDVEAIELLIKNGVKVYNYQHLHAKIYLFGSEKAMVTSANLTYNGMIKNYEYGVLFDNEKEIDIISEDVNALLSNELTGIIQENDVELIKEQVEFYKNNNYKIIVDKDGDQQICSDVKFINPQLNSWNKYVYEIIDKKMDVYFNLHDIYEYENYLKNLYPSNNNIRPKIRQVLQQLRDIGLIKFLGSGSYKKLIK